MLLPKIAENLKNSVDWQELQKHINEECESLRTLDGIDFTDKEKAAIEGQGRQEALRVIETILEPFFSNEQEIPDKAKETANRTGVEL